MTNLFIIFGITGDLAKRMLIPALYELFYKKKLEHFLMIGVANDNTTVSDILESSKNFITHLDSKTWSIFSKKIFYSKLDFTHQDDYKVLYTCIQEQTKHLIDIPNILVYCASSFKFFVDITKNCLKAGIIHKQDIIKKSGWHRIVYEKPFGNNLLSATKINKLVTKLLAENQIFRVDHFIANKCVENLLFLRKTNRVFQACWSSQDIESINITLNESIDIENRGKFYDGTGALRDMVQNHLLQIMALVSLDLPKIPIEITASELQKAKAKILKKIIFINGFLGQYSGYQQEKNVNPKSTTETFAALKLCINNKQWKHTVFYLTTGKALEKQDFSVTITFKAMHSNSNVLKIPLQTDKLADFTLMINMLNSQQETHIKQMALQFSCNHTLPIAPKAYENLLFKLLKNDKTISISFDEIKASWNIIDNIKSLGLQLYSYKKASKGPLKLLC